MGSTAAGSGGGDPAATAAWTEAPNNVKIYYNLCHFGWKSCNTEVNSQNKVHIMKVSAQHL